MIQWSVTASRSAAKTTGLLAAYAIGFLLGTILLRSPLFGLLGIALLFGGTAEYWLPVTFRINEKGAQRQIGLSVTAMSWSEVKWQGGSDMQIWLSPIPNPSSRLAELRGVRLVLTSDNAEEVRLYVSQQLEAAKSDERLLGRGTERGREGEADS